MLARCQNKVNIEKRYDELVRFELRKPSFISNLSTGSANPQEPLTYLIIAINLPLVGMSAILSLVRMIDPFPFSLPQPREGDSTYQGNVNHGRSMGGFPIPHCRMGVRRYSRQAEDGALQFLPCIYTHLICAYAAHVRCKKPFPWTLRTSRVQRQGPRPARSITHRCAQQNPHR